MSCLPRSRLLPAPATTTIGSSSHLGIPLLRLSIPKTHLPPFSHPSLPKTDSFSSPSPPPRLLDSCRCRSSAASKIFFNVASSCCYATAWRHQVSCNFLPPSYPVSFAQTSNIVQRATDSATATFLLSMYSHSGLVPAAWSTLSSPSFVQVLSPSLRAFILVTCRSKPICTPSIFLSIAANSAQVLAPNSSTASTTAR